MEEKIPLKTRILEWVFVIGVVVAVTVASIFAYSYGSRKAESKTIKASLKEDEVTYGEISKLGDGLYEVYFDEYLDYYESTLSYLNDKYYGADGNCTTFYKDGMLMRNLDWYINAGDLNTGETVVHTTSSEGRYATIGVSYNPLITDTTYNTLTAEQMTVVPFILTDGMNSEGLMFGQNVVPEIDGISDTFGTNPDGKKLNFYMLGRELLDNCATVDEAIEYIKTLNIFMIMQDTGYRMESHIMLADKERAVVIEFVDNKVVVLEQSDLPTENPILTNYYLYNGGENTGHGMGYQREAIVSSKYDSVVDWKTGMAVLEAVKYSNSYTLPLDENFWYSEYYVKFTGDDGTEYDFNKDTKNDDPTFVAYIKYLQSKYEEMNGDCWWSNHSSVYDTKDKSLHLAVHENYDKIYTFTIN